MFFQTGQKQQCDLAERFGRFGATNIPGNSQLDSCHQKFYKGLKLYLQLLKGVYVS